MKKFDEKFTVAIHTFTYGKKKEKRTEKKESEILITHINTCLIDPIDIKSKIKT